MISVMLYLTLMIMSRPKKVEGIFADADIDFYAPLSERIAFALNAPAMIFAWRSDSLFDNQSWWFKWCLGLVPTFALWYLIGLWLDRFHLPPTTHSSIWRTPTRLIAIVVMGGVLLLMGLTASKIYTSQLAPSEWGFEVFASLVVWPVLVCVIAIRTIRRGVY